jgi:hypothetical protein
MSVGKAMKYPGPSKVQNFVWGCILVGLLLLVNMIFGRTAKYQLGLFWRDMCMMAAWVWPIYGIYELFIDSFISLSALDVDA